MDCEFNDIVHLVINRVEACSVSPQGIDSICKKEVRELHLPCSLSKSLGTQCFNPVYTSLQGLYIPKAEAKVSSHITTVITLEKSIVQVLSLCLPRS